MRIANIMGVYETTPPAGYGGIERVAGMLEAELTARGHNVVTFATGDSRPAGTLVSFVNSPRRASLDYGHVLHAAETLKAVRNGGFDIVHLHNDYLIPTAEFFNVPVVVTLHNGVNSNLAGELYQKYMSAYEMNPFIQFVAISDNELKVARSYARNATRVYNPVDVDKLTFGSGEEGYLAFLGRFNRSKGLHVAIQVAKATGMNLRIAAKAPSPDEEAYYESVRPDIDGKVIRYIGEINDVEKNYFLGHAAALLLPLQWDEPFGLVMPESLACGTPVVAFRKGAAPEIVTQGTGFVVDTTEEMIAAVGRLETIERSLCRRRSQDFGVNVAVNGYVELYQKLVSDFRNQQYPVPDNGDEGIGLGLTN